MSQTRPHPAGTIRRLEAEARRNKASAISMRTPIAVAANQEEVDFADKFPTSFTKGLKHNQYGLVENADHYQTFVDLLTRPIDATSVAFNVPIGASDPSNFRGWESPLAGQYYSLEGADPANVAMAPAPRAGASELCAEMAEVYAMALVRDVPFSELDNPGFQLNKSSIGVDLTFPEGYPEVEEGRVVTLGDLLNELNKLSWFNDELHDPLSSNPEKAEAGQLTSQETRRRKARWENGQNKLTIKTLFRGSTSGAQKGHYLSQFMLLGTNGRAGGKFQNGGQAPNTSAFSPLDGLITFGTNTIDQRVMRNTKHIDFMTTWESWLSVQQGEKQGKDKWDEERVFITTGRDLSGYVHFDQLYQAYFNACLIMLGNDVMTDSDFPAKAHDEDGNNIVPLLRAPFATFGPPHILSLFTEVATRALKAVRRQKFQVHRRARPEVLAARLTLAANGKGSEMGKAADTAFMSMLKELSYDDPTVEKKPSLILYWVQQMNEARNSTAGATNPKWHNPKTQFRNYLLPMVFPEGSPMHPAYGAGHATVAAACVTVLKAFFRSDLPFEKAITGVGAPVVGDDAALSKKGKFAGETIGEELDKLAANVAIGRNFAGVHYYTDYYDSLRMGERIAASILEEQMLNYPEPVSMSFKSFDGDDIKISNKQVEPDNWMDAATEVGGDEGNFIEWWERHIRDDNQPAIDEIQNLLVAQLNR
ncbi:MAG: vanadium-dependent haloperoxidase [Pseudomonadota bacterium]